MSELKKYKGFEMFDEKEPGKPQNWCCTISIVIAVCSLNVIIIVGLRFMLEIKDSMGDSILTAEQRDLVVQLLALMSMSFGFGCCGCFCCACRIPFYTIKAVKKMSKIFCFECIEDGNSDNDSLVNNMYDQRNHSKRGNWQDIESGSSGTTTPQLPLSPSSQKLSPISAAKTRCESRRFTKGWGSSIAKQESKEIPEPKPSLTIVSTGLLEPMESLRHIEQQFYCPGLLTAETPMPRVVPKRRMTLATETPLFDGKTFIF